jgi:hypothetical protein
MRLQNQYGSLLSLLDDKLVWVACNSLLHLQLGKSQYWKMRKYGLMGLCTRASRSLWEHYLADEALERNIAEEPLLTHIRDAKQKFVG